MKGGRGGGGGGAGNFHHRLSLAPVLIVLLVIFQYGLLSYQNKSKVNIILLNLKCDNPPAILNLIFYNAYFESPFIFKRP